MSTLEIALAVINGVALPLLLWRAQTAATLASRVADQAIAIARLEERTELIADLTSEIRNLRDAVGDAVRTLAGLEGKLETALRERNAS